MPYRYIKVTLFIIMTLFIIINCDIIYNSDSDIIYNNNKAGNIQNAHQQEDKKYVVL